VLAPVLAATPAHDPSSAEREANRQLLEKWKTDPEHYARLQRDLRDFWTLPQTERERMRQLDKDFHQLDEKTRKRLRIALERYRLWLAELPEEDRKRIESASDGPARLQTVKDVRERQWIERLPRPVRDEVMKLQGAARTARVAQLREQERQQRKKWLKPIPLGPGRMPLRLGEFPKDVRDFVEKQVMPHLTAEELRQYRQAEGQPEFARTLLRLSEAHPVLPPRPKPMGPIVRYEDLPVKSKGIAGAKVLFERRLDKWDKVQALKGKWPEWALAFQDMLTKEQRGQMPALGASRPSEFSPTIQEFIKEKLQKALRDGERRKLRNQEGKWPEYPKLLLELAFTHKLQVPGMSLPGPWEMWNSARKP
jgi:hypothetical protein